jgi:ferredoxin-type protein NapH
MKALEALKRHKWRYFAMAGGFVLFVYPAALLVRAANAIEGSTGASNLHKICFRMPFDWLFGGRLAIFDGRLFLVLFLLGALGVAFLFGPLFCGWLCPVGSSTELLSRPVPRRLKIDLSRKMNPAALRYGFLASFALISVLGAVAPSLNLAGICCRYCASSQLQNLVEGIFHPTALAYWHSGAILTLGAWLFVGGVFWKGGRGWCLYACPLGALSNLFHTAGVKLGFAAVRHDGGACSECSQCEDACPSWAITRRSTHVSVNLHTCNACLECVKACPSGCFSYGRKK